MTTKKSTFEIELEEKDILIATDTAEGFFIHKNNVLKAKNKTREKILQDIDNIKDVWSVKLVDKIKQIINKHL